MEEWNKTCGQSSCQAWTCRSDAEGCLGAFYQYMHGLLGIRCLAVYILGGSTLV